MKPTPYEKHMEGYNNFSGGLNTVTASDNMNDSEMLDLTNVDLGERGSLRRRTGMSVPDNHLRTATWRDVGPKRWSDL
jgi:hypothetical protein